MLQITYKYCPAHDDNFLHLQRCANFLLRKVVFQIHHLHDVFHVVLSQTGAVTFDSSYESWLFMTHHLFLCPVLILDHETQARLVSSSSLLCVPTLCHLDLIFPLHETTLLSSLPSGALPALSALMLRLTNIHIFMLSHSLFLIKSHCHRLILVVLQF